MKVPTRARETASGFSQADYDSVMSMSNLLPTPILVRKPKLDPIEQIVLEFRDCDVTLDAAAVTRIKESVQIIQTMSAAAKQIKTTTQRRNEAQVALTRLSREISKSKTLEELDKFKTWYDHIFLLLRLPVPRGSRFSFAKNSAQQLACGLALQLAKSFAPHNAKPFGTLCLRLAEILYEATGAEHFDMHNAMEAFRSRNTNY
jgi:hypothetical protein